MATSTDETGLLAAIEADPAGDLPRLVYADYLEERGEANRAEFIRLQCRLAPLERGPRAVANAHVHLWVRQQELLDNHLSELAPVPLPEGVGAALFERGFLTRLDLAWEQTLAVAPHFPELRPRPTVIVRGVYDSWRDWPGVPNLGFVTRLDLTSRDFSSRVESNEPGLSAAWAGWRELESLSLSRNLIGESGVRVIPWGQFTRLKSLDLSHNALGDGGVIALLNTGVLRRVEELDLRANELTDQSAYELSDRLGRDSPIRRLVVGSNRLSSEGHSELTRRFPGRAELF